MSFTCNVKVAVPSNIHWSFFLDYCSSSSKCQNDVKLVCSDGTMTGNSLMMQRWSGLIRSFMEEDYQTGQCQECDSGITVLLPDFSIEIVTKAMEWSSRGEVSLRTKDFSSVREVIKVLGGRAKEKEKKMIETSKRKPAKEWICKCQDTFFSEKGLLFHQELCQTHLEYLKKNKKTTTMIVDTISPAPPQAKKLLLDDMETAELPSYVVEDFPTVFSMQGLKNCHDDVNKRKEYHENHHHQHNHQENQQLQQQERFTCTLCRSASAFDSRSSIIRHIAVSHFKEELLRTYIGHDWLEKEFETCPVCNRVFGTRQKGAKRNQIAMHLAWVHKKLREVVPRNLIDYVDTLMEEEQESILGT